MIYVCTGDTGSTEMLADYCRTFAAAREWTVVDTALDADRRMTLAERTGWQRVEEMLASGAADGVVTLTHAMLADTLEAYEALCVLAAEAGAFVTCARSGPSEKPPRRSPGDILRRWSLTTAAAGWSDALPAPFVLHSPLAAEGTL